MVGVGPRSAACLAVESPPAARGQLARADQLTRRLPPLVLLRTAVALLPSARPEAPEGLGRPSQQTAAAQMPQGVSVPSNAR